MSQSASSLHSISEQPLWIFGSSGPLRSELTNWLSAFSWQQTHELSHIKKALLSTAESVLLVDMMANPHRMLAQIRFLQEHFIHCVVVAVVDSEDGHWGQEALRQGADAYLSPEAVSSAGLEMVLDSLQKQKRQQLQQTSIIDPCTGLINGPLFFDRLNHALQVAVRHQCRTGLLLVSLDDFPKLVSSHGEVLCDGLLNLVANQLKAHIRNSDSLCRLRDGTFGILLEDLQDDVMVGHIAKHIQQGFNEPVHFQNIDYAMKVSIGGHLCQNGELNGQTLYQQVEVALERAQASDNNTIWFYTPDMNFKAMARLNMQQGLQRALDRDEFYMQYQPCHTAKGFMSNGMIPVLRWRHPTAGVVMSDVFMSLLKDSGLILPVGRWQIQAVLNQLKNWQQSGHWNMRQKMFLSVCEKQLREPSFSDFLQQELLDKDIGTEQIVVQISERTAIRNMSALLSLSKHIPGLGLCINLTDFGKQYSSLSYLRQLNVDCLCLDQSFFLHMHMDHLETSIAKVVVDVAHRLGIEVLAVGADSQFKVEKMQALGCDALIGDFFTAPLYADSWPDYLKSHS